MDAKLQDALKRANTEVENAEITDPELKKIAFSKAVDFYLRGEENSPSQPKAYHEEGGERPDFWIALSSSTGIDEKKLKDVYLIKGDQIFLVVSSVPGESKADQQRSLALLILFAYHEGFGHEWISSSLLAKAADHSKLYDTSKFAKNIGSKETNWFNMGGIKKSRVYKLSGPGINQAKSLISTITQ